jgi:hypothetical protein
VSHGVNCCLSVGAVLLSTVVAWGAPPTAGSTDVGPVWGPSATDRVVRVSGIYPHLTVYNGYGECGIGAIVPWADRLWFITYPPHMPQGSQDKLYTVDKTLRLTVRPESVGGTHANRMIHTESQQAILGPYLIDAQGKVRVVDLKQLVGRMTATARHLTDPAHKVYFIDMEGTIYEVDVCTLTVKCLFDKPVAGWHSKGGYTAQGRLVVSNNGEYPAGKWRRQTSFLAGSLPGSPEDMGILAAWDGTAWQQVERHQFTEVTGPGGIQGSPSSTSPLWALGWDKRSVLLKLLDGGRWYTFRLPKASYTQEARGGWYTEWPRIRAVTNGRLLAHMQCLFYDFPQTFSAANYGGLRPISTYTRMPVDYCAWQGQIVMTRDDASVMQNELAGQSHSSLWFGSWADLENLGAPVAWGGPWLDDTVAAGQVSDPFLVNGFSEGVLHLRHASATAAEFAIEADHDGRGQWRSVATVSVPAGGYAYRILDEELKAQWVRLRAVRAADRVSAFFRLGNRPRAPAPERFQALADVGDTGPVLEGMAKPAMHDARQLLLAVDRVEKGQVQEKAAWTMDGRLAFAPLTDTGRERILRSKYGRPTKPDFSIDAASVIVRVKDRQYRLPKTATEYDRPFASGWPRGRREVVTERSLLNAHGTIYEVPRADAGDYARMRPICTHGKRITDFASWRGMLVLVGVRADAQADEHCYRSADGRAAVWFGEVDDLWSLGAPVGVGGPWRDTPVEAGRPSDPYLMAGYRTKTLSLSHRDARPVTFTVEVDFAADGSWSPYARITVPASQTVTHRFPAGYSAHWVRLSASHATTATATLRYEP